MLCLAVPATADLLLSKSASCQHPLLQTLHLATAAAAAAATAGFVLQCDLVPRAEL
jgi:hypothetical protein